VPEYCRWTPTGVPALLQIHRLVDDQHRLGITEVLADELADIGADRGIVPLHPGQQVLHPVRAHVSGMLGDRPAILGR
jgi:hypothetical protein